MKNPSHIIFSILIFAVLTLPQYVGAESCTIESGPIPELAQYSRDVDTELTRLSRDGSQAWVCGISKSWASVWVERTLSVIDGASTRLSYFPNLLLDFRYNIQVAINGEAREPVMRDGILFSTIDARITRSLSTLASKCNLSDQIQSDYTRLLSDNQTLSNIFKQAALWVPVEPSGLSLANLTLARSINSTYIPTATAWCIPKNNQSIFDGIKTIIAVSLKKIETTGSKNDSVWTDWKKAIALFQWGNASMKSSEYTDIQRKLLQQELSRQWYSSRSAQAMLGNFDCFKTKTQWDATAEWASIAQQRCFSNPIVWLENILLPWKQLVASAKNTVDRSNYVNKLSKENTLKTSIISTYSKLEIYRTPAIDIKSALMSNLIDIHLGLISTSEQVEKRLPIMYINCMKAQPSISCPRP